MNSLTLAALARVSPRAGDHVQSRTSHHPDTDGIVLETNAFRFRSSYLPIHTRHGAAAPAEAYVEPHGPEAWARRAHGFGIEAAPGSDTWQVALVLLASVEVGQNIDRLARRTGTPRQLVAKCARRLVDNGVWADGRVVAKWTTDPTADTAFQRDVAVGLGHLLRRITEGGRMEWAEAGRWNKSFERHDDDSMSTTYFDAAPRADQPVALAEDLEGIRAAPAPAPKAASPAPAPAPAAETAVQEVSAADSGDVDEGADDGELQPEAPEDREPAGHAPSLEQVFSDAVWLR